MKKKNGKPIIDGTLYDLVFAEDPGLDDYLAPALEALESSDVERDVALFNQIADSVFERMPFITADNAHEYHAAIEKLLFAIIHGEDGRIMKACSSLNGMLLFFVISEMWWSVHEDEGIDQEGMTLYRKHFVHNTLLIGIYGMEPDARVGNTLLVNIMETLCIADDLGAPEYVEEAILNQYLAFCDELYERNWIYEENMEEVAMFYSDATDMFKLTEDEVRSYCRKAYELFDRTGNLTSRNIEIKAAVVKCRNVLGI